MEDEKLEKVLKDMSYSLNHIEDMTADHRAIIIKLVKQNNSIVEFLKQLDIDPDDLDNLSFSTSSIQNEDLKKNNKTFQIKELLDEYIDKNKDLQELEQELKKHKDKITPGQVGEA
jgi:hypothetical protein